VIKIKGLRRRWLINTVAVVCTLGLVCVLAITAAFAAYYYSSMQSDMHYRARTTTEFFSENLSLNYNEYYQSCIKYAKTFEDKNNIELQFIDTDGQIVASSYGEWTGQSHGTSDIFDAMRSRDIVPYVGKNPLTGERIMAVSSPMIYSNGEVIGVLRYVTSTAKVDQQILKVGLVTLAVCFAIIAIVSFFRMTSPIRSASRNLI